MKINFTQTQRQRINELDAFGQSFQNIFTSELERDLCFKNLNHQLVKENKDRLANLQKNKLRLTTREIELSLIQQLYDEGFVEVSTPIIMSLELLKKMGVGENHPLRKQIFMLEDNKCLRPMLAPHLYHLLFSLKKLWARPIRIFEIGPCFRKESHGAKHLEEFTMLNLVEMGPQDDGKARLKYLIKTLMNAIDIQYELVDEQCDVYGDTFDVIATVEVASAVVGPHPLDRHWGIDEPWAGVGLGIERLAMIKQKYAQIRRVGRSLTYLDGTRLNI